MLSRENEKPGGLLSRLTVPLSSFHVSLGLNASLLLTSRCHFSTHSGVSTIGVSEAPFSDALPGLTFSIILSSPPFYSLHLAYLVYNLLMSVLRLYSDNKFDLLSFSQVMEPSNPVDPPKVSYKQALVRDPSNTPYGEDQKVEFNTPSLSIITRILLPGVMRIISLIFLLQT